MWNEMTDGHFSNYDDEVAFYERWEKEIRQNTPRSQRARRFAHNITMMMRDYIPRDSDSLRLIETYLTKIAFVNNSELISVPLEWDSLNKAEIERAMLDNHPIFIRAKKDADSSTEIFP